MIPLFLNMTYTVLNWLAFKKLFDSPLVMNQGQLFSKQYYTVYLLSRWCLLLFLYGKLFSGYLLFIGGDLSTYWWRRALGKNWESCTAPSHKRV